MENKLKTLIEKYQNAKRLEINNQKFFDETIFDSVLSAAIFDEVNISNPDFEETDFLSSHFRNYVWFTYNYTLHLTKITIKFVK